MSKNPRWYSGTMYAGEKFIDLNNCQGRVVPRSTSSGYEWTTWTGRNRTARHGVGTTRTQAAAKRAAVKSCKRLA